MTTEPKKTRKLGGFGSRPITIPPGLPGAEDGRWITPAQAVKLTGRALSTIYTWARNGTIASAKVNDDHILIDKDSLLGRVNGFVLRPALSILIGLLCLLPALSHADWAVVSRIVDGDTFVLTTGESIRTSTWGGSPSSPDYPMGGIEFIGQQRQCKVSQLTNNPNQDEENQQISNTSSH